MASIPYRLIPYDSLSPSMSEICFIFSYLFWADAGDTPKIDRSDPIGGSRTVLVWQGLVTPTCLSIDNQTDRYGT